MSTSDKREKISVCITLYYDQECFFNEKHLKKSEILRELADEWIKKNYPKESV